MFPNPGQENYWFLGTILDLTQTWFFNPVDSIVPGQNMRDWLLSMKHGDIIYIRRFESLPEFCYHTVTSPPVENYLCWTYHN